MKVLLIDDDVSLSGMLKEYLSAEGFTPTVIGSGEAGIEAALSGEYDAVILDIMLPNITGIEVLRSIRKTSRIPIIMLTAKGDNIDRVIGLELGADDYVPKPCYPRELLARLRAVLRRTQDNQSTRRDESLTLGLLSLFPAQRNVEWNNVGFDLTVTEFDMLKLLLENKDRVVTKNELSEQVIGRPRQVYDRSIDVHASNLRLKLQAITQKCITIETVRGVGYRIRKA
jgi:two-component system OmpR family response regulator